MFRRALLTACLFLAPAASARTTREADLAYRDAHTAHQALKKDTARRKFRHHWLNVADKYEAVARQHPRTDRAPEALFNAAQMLEELSRISRAEEDLLRAAGDYRRVVELAPQHPLGDDAALEVARIQADLLGRPEDARRTAEKALKQLPRGDKQKELRALLASLPPEKGRKGKGKEEAREAGPKQPRQALLAAMARASEGEVARRPPEAPPARIPPEREASAGPPPSARTEASPPAVARAEPSAPEAVRGAAPAVRPAPAAEPRPPEPAPAAVQAAKPGASSGAATVPAHPGAEVPAGLPVVVAQPSERPEPPAAPERRLGAREAKARIKAMGGVKDPEITLAEQLGLKVRRVVIDPGHGGHDSGALGPTGKKEKDVSLAISKKVAKQLRDAGLEVLLTREKDTFVRLEDRAAFANEHRGDLFISIHCNSATSKKLRGVETYSLNIASDRYSIRLAARENASSEKSISDLQFILADLATKANTEESSRLAKRVQGALVNRLAEKDPGLRDLGHKQALFYVLLGAKMPAILVETSFISNPEDEKRLASGKHQDQVAAAIASGVQAFLEDRERVAHVE